MAADCRKPYEGRKIILTHLFSGEAVDVDRDELIAALARYRRPGSPVYDHHFQRLPASVVRPENVDELLSILRDERLPAKVREHAAGALGEIRDGRAVGALVAALADARLRRGAAVALGRMRADEARDALAKLAPRVKVARWAVEQFCVADNVEQALDDLRGGQLRDIQRKLRKYPDELRDQIGRRVCEELRRVVSGGVLAHEHGWLMTCLQYLRPPQAGAVLTETLLCAVRQRDMAVSVRARLLRAAGAVGPVDAVLALVDLMCAVDYPCHKQIAAVCVEKIIKLHGRRAVAAVAEHRARLALLVKRLEKELASTEPVIPPKPWIHVPGSPGWQGHMQRAIGAIERLLRRSARPA